MFPEAILLDYDGVIVDSEPLYERVERRQFARYGINPSLEDWAQFKGISAEAFFRLIKEKYLPETNISELNVEWQADLLKEFRENLSFVQGFESFYAQALGKTKLAIVTSTSKEIITWIGENSNRLPTADLIITADDVQNTKPHPEPYLKAAEMLGIAPDRSLVIEDSVHGIRSGLAAGAKVLAFSTSLDAKFLKEAHAVVGHFGEITPALLDTIMNNGKI
ncbi:MAG TPA: HAD family phosphatase [Candidatus Marinimicrobia bacterium]|nr:HAD family phosphatase [Candidatus Neomarinimicrobiota bacterium]